VNFTVYFWVESQQANVLAVSDRVATGIKLALDRAQIDMPYPHTVVLFHDATGSRSGDITREKYLGARRPEEEATGGASNGGGRAVKTESAAAREGGTE
jgi:small-conductance mechanosensitive channel